MPAASTTRDDIAGVARALINLSAKTPSTILDVTMDRPRILREGVLTVAALDEILAVHDLTVIDEG